MTDIDLSTPTYTVTREPDGDRRWTREERLASLIHSQANAGRSAQDRSDAADRASIAPIPTTTRAALRAIEARRLARINPACLNDAALGRYASQWAGTTRGDAALAEIARRPSVAFDVAAYDARAVADAEALAAARNQDDAAPAPVIGTLGLTDDVRQACPLPANRDTLADLNDDALGRYADQWRGTERGAAAWREIGRRQLLATHAAGPITADTFNALDYPAGYARCNCSECRELAEREAEIRAARTADDTPTPYRFAVTEHIRHGNYRYDLTETATTLLGAVYAVLVASPYATATQALADRIAGDLFTTGHAEHGWSTFER